MYIHQSSSHFFQRETSLVGVVLVVTCRDYQQIAIIERDAEGFQGSHTEVEVVLHAVAHDQDTSNGVGEGYSCQ